MLTCWAPGTWSPARVWRSKGLLLLRLRWSPLAGLVGLEASLRVRPLDVGVLTRTLGVLRLVVLLVGHSDQLLSLCVPQTVRDIISIVSQNYYFVNMSYLLY